MFIWLIPCMQKYFPRTLNCFHGGPINSAQAFFTFSVVFPPSPLGLSNFIGMDLWGDGRGLPGWRQIGQLDAVAQFTGYLITGSGLLYPLIWSETQVVLSLNAPATGCLGPFICSMSQACRHLARHLPPPAFAGPWCW